MSPPAARVGTQLCFSPRPQHYWGRADSRHLRCVCSMAALVTAARSRAAVTIQLFCHHPVLSSSHLLCNVITSYQPHCRHPGSTCCSLTWILVVTGPLPLALFNLFSAQQPENPSQSCPPLRRSFHWLYTECLANTQPLLGCMRPRVFLSM